MGWFKFLKQNCGAKASSLEKGCHINTIIIFLDGVNLVGRELKYAVLY